MAGQHLRLGQIVGHLAKAVHVVGKSDQMSGNVRQSLEGMADPTGAGDFAKGADMRQTRGAIASLEQHLLHRFCVGAALLDSRQKLAGFLKRPGLSGKCLIFQVFHGKDYHLLGLFLSVLKGRKS